MLSLFFFMFNFAWSGILMYVVYLYLLGKLEAMEQGIVKIAVGLVGFSIWATVCFSLAGVLMMKGWENPFAYIAAIFEFFTEAF